MGLLDLDPGRYDTDKSAKYLANYDRWFGHLADRPISLLELGVQRGGSLQMWRDAFPEATVVGLDLNPVAVEGDRIRVYQGFQQDRSLLDRVAAEQAPDGFDVIIDDASHLGVYTAESFWHLFPRHLKAGGLYVLEDWSCAYWPTWSDGHRFEGALQVASGTPARSSRAVLQKGMRRVARPVSSFLRKVPGVHARLERVFVGTERHLVQTRFPSHEYGMAGFVKQLVDATASSVIARDPGSVPPPDVIARIEVTASQVLIVKSG